MPLFRAMKMQEKSINHYKRKASILTLFVLCSLFSFSQRIEPIIKDSAVPQLTIQQNKFKDSIAKKIYSPKKAAIRSAIFPGLGQI